MESHEPKPLAQALALDSSKAARRYGRTGVIESDLRVPFDNRKPV
jgi:hypothetical protein